MCNRFALDAPLWDERIPAPLNEWPTAWTPRYNLAPTAWVPVVRMRGGVRETDLLRWGLVPRWSKDSSNAARCTNAVSETIWDKPSFRDAIRRRRCLVPFSHYYEWTGPKTARQPWLIRPKDEPHFFAGVWESWQQPDGTALETFSIPTTEAAPAISQLHHRMPVILDQEDEARWLDPTATQDQIRALLRPWCGRLEFYQVSPYVNNARHEGPECALPPIMAPG